MQAALAGLALAAVAGCSSGTVGDPGGAGAGGGNVTSDRAGFAVESLALSAGDGGVTIDPRKSLIATEQQITSRFSLQNVLDLLIAQSKISQPARDLAQQLWDTNNPAPGVTRGPHCDDQKVNGKPAINGFPVQCPRFEGLQAHEDPFADPNTNQAFFATALVNRFDLAPPNGATCGENRVIFARNSSQPNTDGFDAGIVTGLSRAFVIFEAVVPNPRPDLGLKGCMPIEQFWASLSSISDVNQRGSLLYNYFFFGLPSSGVGPILHIDNLGNATTRPTGQVRTNAFMQSLPPVNAATGNPGDSGWMLKQYEMRVDCTTGPCKLRAMPVSVKANPWVGLFDPNRSDTQAQKFQSWFVSQVPNLAVNDINRFNYDGGVVPDEFNAGQSESFAGNDFGTPLPTPENDYLATFSGGASGNAFHGALQNALTAIRSPLSPEQIVARATALSCGGCHFISGNQDLGFPDGGPQPQFGNASPFVQVSEIGFEDNTLPAGQRQFAVSPALKLQFLPFRKAVLEQFLNGG
jgi:hypothetical protein